MINWILFAALAILPGGLIPAVLFMAWRKKQVKAKRACFRIVQGGKKWFE